MNKKLGTLLFILGGLFVNLFFMSIFCISLILGTAYIMDMIEVQSGAVRVAVMMLSVFVGFGLSFIVYSKVVNIVQAKFHLENYIAPIFKKKKKY